MGEQHRVIPQFSCIKHKSPTSVNCSVRAAINKPLIGVCMDNGSLEPRLSSPSQLNRVMETVSKTLMGLTQCVVMS